MFTKPLLTSFMIYAFSSLSSTALSQQLQSNELEDGAVFGPYASTINSPFEGVAAYGNDDGVDTQLQLSNIPGRFRIDISGASSNTTTASISAYLANEKLGTASFSGTSNSIDSIDFDLSTTPSNTTLRLVLENDDGSNDTFLDKFTLHRVGDVTPPPEAPTLPSAGSYDSGEYRNMFAELGYSKTEINSRMTAVYEQLFHSTNTDQESGEAILIETDNNSAYIWDVHNNDVRSEGLSYGMMIALQMDRQEDFDKIWTWAYNNTLNTSGDYKGYFGWKTSISGQQQDKAPAPDGEEYFVTALFFAANRWGNGTGIYNYQAHANKILDDMFGNGQTRFNNQGQLEQFSLFNHEEQQIVFSPSTPTDRNWTDPSYHLPAFYELWARWADNNKEFWANLAITSRAFFKTTVHPTTGLSPDYAYFDGRPYAGFGPQHQYFEYDAWRTAGNIGLDYAWFKQDPWATTFSKRIHNFFIAEGVSTHGNLYELNGTERNGGRSPGLIAMNAIAALASDDANAYKFVQELWNTDAPQGRYRYYDGTLYLFGMLAMSGNYRIYCPNGECDFIDNDDGDTDGDDTGGGNTETALPGKLEAELFSQQIGIQTENTRDVGGGQNIAYIQNGDRTQYSITVATAGRYKVELRAASATPGGLVTLNTDNQNNIGSLAIGDTGGWQNWQTVSTDVDLKSGSQTLTLNFSGNNEYLFNINWLNFSLATGDASPSNVSCEFITTDSWENGFTGNIKVTNLGSTTIDEDWSVSWSYSDNSTMLNGWNANFSENKPYTATPLPWNRQLAPGQSIEFGIQNNKGVSGSTIPEVTVTGSICG